MYRVHLIMPWRKILQIFECRIIEEMRQLEQLEVMRIPRRKNAYGNCMNSVTNSTFQPVF
jgi:hypothetical protein